MECLRTKCANRSANAIANIKIQFFNIKIQFIDITKHGTNNKIYNLECKIQTLILAVITLHILQQRYSNVEKPTVVSLVRQLSRLQLGEDEKLHEYFIRSQELMSRLSEVGEKISETLFNALIINGLPDKYEHFVVQESFNPASTFTELRTRLQNYEDSRIQRNQTEDNSSVAMHSSNRQARNKSSTPQTKNCYVCGNPGHFAKQCNKRSSATCSICKKRGHWAKAYRSAGKTEKSQGKEPPAVSSYSNCFVSPLQEENNGSEYSNYLIVDTGGTDHIINQNNVFDENLRPCNEKSVRDPKGNLTPVEGIGDVPITVQLKDGKMAEMVLRNVLYVPSYEVNLLSVNTAVSFGHRFIFHESKARMVLNDGHEINLKKDTGLFFLKVAFRNLIDPVTCNTSKGDIKGDIGLWHKRLGHLNKVDVERTIGCKNNSKDVCETCAMGKQASKPEYQKKYKPKLRKLSNLFIQTFSVLSK